jgi:transaldolase
MEYSGRIRMFYDGTNLAKYAALPYITGITTNTAFMKQSGNTDYKEFYDRHAEHIGNKDISLQVFEEDPKKAYQDALRIASYGKNVYVKLPVIDSHGRSNGALIKKLVEAGVKLNITAVYTEEQLEDIYDLLTAMEPPPKSPVIVSIFCGRISDTGRDPVPVVIRAVLLYQHLPTVSVLWAGCKEVLSVSHAINAGCHIITVPDPILDRFSRIGKDLTELSRETVQSFLDDAISSGIVV